MNKDQHPVVEEFQNQGLKANRALKDTARTYLAKTPMQIDVDQIESAIRSYPLPLIGAALALGFVVGKLAKGSGLVVLAALSRNVAREAAGNFARRMVGIAKA